MRRTDPADWMWAQACDMLEEAQRMHQRFFRLAPTDPAHSVWEPPIDVFEDEREIVIVAAMPGVSAERVRVVHERGTLVIRGERPLPFTGLRLAVRQLEIPYGAFERRIPLPQGHFEVGMPELTHGCLVLRLRKNG
jgi:HSP20 family molecular chaperone IbpA